MLFARLIQFAAARASVALGARDQRGQATAEYALVLVVAAIIGTAVIVWASGTSLIAQLFEQSLGRVASAVSG